MSFFNPQSNEDVYHVLQVEDYGLSDGFEYSTAFQPDLIDCQPLSSKGLINTRHQAVEPLPQRANLQLRRQYVDRQIIVPHSPSFVVDSGPSQVFMSSNQPFSNSNVGNTFHNGEFHGIFPLQNCEDSSSFSSSQRYFRSLSDNSASWETVLDPEYDTMLKNSFETGPFNLTHASQTEVSMNMFLSPAPTAFQTPVQVHPKPKAHKCGSCHESFVQATFLAQHIHTTHPELFECQQCHSIFEVLGHLNQHAFETKHAAFRCSELGCTATFTRSDDLRRHDLKHQPDAHQWHCQHCSKSFARKDHLTQHMRNYHRIGILAATSVSRRSCPYPSCAHFRNSDAVETGPMPFNGSKKYHEHMRRVHNETPFPCSEAGCDRVGANGYFRAIDLVKHQRKTHRGS